MCDAEDFKSYLSNLEEFVFDENKIVSVKWFSVTLQIQVSLAKQLMTTFAKDEQFKDKLSTSWFVYGRSTNEQTKKVLIVPESMLESVKNKFTKITSQHIYSIQKRVDDIDLNTVYLAAQSYEAPVDASPSSLSSIKCSRVKLVENRRNNVVIEASKPITTSSNLNPVFKPVSKSPQKNSVSPKKNETFTQKNTILGNMFSEKEQSNKTNNKKEVEPEQKKEEDESVKKDNVENKESASPAKKPASVGKKKIPVKGTSSISSFFSKNPLSVQKKKDVPVNKDETKRVATKNKEEPEDDGWMMDVEEPDENKKPAEPIDNVKIKKDTKDKSKRQKKVIKETPNNTKNDKKAQPKRKRIQVQSDSSDSEDDQSKELLDHVRSPSPLPISPPKVNLSDEEEDIIPPTPEPAQKGRKRKRKLVSKTMMDESGFLRTVKEFETVSCSDSDGESQLKSESQVKQENKKLKVSESNVTKKSPIKQTKKSGQIISSHNSKQTSILGFFSKKS